MTAELQFALKQANALASQGQFAAAETQYRRARALDPKDLHAALGHGHVLRMLGRPGEARDVFAAAITVKPDLADAHYGLALACQEMGDPAAAEAAFRAAIQLQPGLLPAIIGLSEVLNQQLRGDEALALLAPIRTADPKAVVALEQARGTARLLKEDYGTALAHFDHVLSAAPGHPRAGHARALALQHMGRVEEALAAFRKVVAEQPANLGVHHDLNHLLHRLKRDDELLRSYDEAAKRIPDMPHFAIGKAGFLLRDGKAQEALACYDRALGLAPGHPLALHGKAGALLKLGRTEAAIDYYRQALKQTPDSIDLLTGLATACLMARDIAKAEDAATAALTRAPTDQVALAALGTAWRLKGDAREEHLNRYGEFVRIIDLEPPAGYCDMESFNRDLNAWLDSRHGDLREHIDQSLRGGTQTMGNIFAAGNSLVLSLKARIEEAVADVIASLPPDSRHPFLGRRAEHFAFAGSWSSRLHDQGFHANHLHPGGWISSAYYVALPDSMASGEGRQGWLQFGEPSYDVGLSEPVRRAVQPKPGRLVLFPSYMWHGTVPFRAPQSRTTIAFDVVPQSRRGGRERS